MDVDVPLVWSLLGCTNNCRAPNLLGRGDGDGTPPATPLQPLGFGIPRSVSRRRRFIHPEAYPSKHQYTWSFTKHAQALPAASGARIQPGKEKRAPSHAPDHGSMEADSGITQRDLHGPTEGCTGSCSAHPGHRQS